MFRLTATIPLEVIEIAMRIGLQAGGKFMGVRRHLPLIVEILIEVSFAIIIVVVEYRDLIASEDVHELLVPALHDLQTERLKQACRETPPRDSRQRFVNAAHQPDIAV